MPTPWVPPDPDMPRPLLWDPARPFTAFPITLKGMSPHEEQPDHAFFLEGRPLSIMMVELRDATTHAYHGVALGDASHLGTLGKAAVRGVHVPTDKSRTESIAVKKGGLSVGPTGVTHRWDAAGRAIISASGKPPSGSLETWYVMAVPYAPRPTQRHSLFSTYRAQAAWRPLPPTGGRVELTVTAARGADYGVFLATNVPACIVVGSSAARIRLS